MAQRIAGETGYYHAVTRTAGQIALFEDDDDRRTYLRIMRSARDETDVSIIAWVLMTDHVHLVLDSHQSIDALRRFMYLLNKTYARYFNVKTDRTGHLFQGNFWSKPISNERQLIATVYYIHQNPETAGIMPFRDYRWSSYQEYAGKHWVVDTKTVLDIFGSFEAFDAYRGSPDDVIRPANARRTDEEVLALALQVSSCSTSGELRTLPTGERNRVVRILHGQGIGARAISRAFGIGASTVSRIVKS